ncbi:hypothetical protein ACIRPK_16470 [Kitasatospora sp. NPDC101801]|uniref:hypothetical protein n=1 Tax=Kitasatospora sp. NPDC101801 TaxID=3364103 RepID=UPI00381CAEA0
MTHLRSTSRLLAAALLAAAGLFTAGCAAHPPTPGTATAPGAAPSATLPPLPRPAIHEIPVADSTADKSMPVEAYLFSSEQRHQVDTARGTLTAQCMRRFGLAYTPEAPPPASARGQATHRYDVVAPANGYRPAEPPTPRPAPPQLSPEVVGVLAGRLPGGAEPSTSYHGTPIPPGGCLGEADARLTAQGGSMLDSQLAVGINFDNYRRSMTDDRLTAVFRAWSDCMRAEGHGYPTPDDAMKDPRWKTGTGPASPEEVAVATADARCRQRTNVIGTWFAVESAYEAEAIAGNLAELTGVRQGIAAVVRNASTVNSGGGDR